MTDDQKKSLSMALDFAFGGGKREPRNGDEGRAIILRTLNRAAWPKGGLKTLAHEIVYRAITREWP